MIVLNVVVVVVVVAAAAGELRWTDGPRFARRLLAIAPDLFTVRGLVYHYGAR
jgi:hypothetical protein